MSKSPDEIYELFQYALLVDEEIYWLGEPLHNHWHIKGRHLFYIMLAGLLVPALLVGFLAIMLGLSVLQGLFGIMTSESFVLVFYILLLVFTHRPKQAPDYSKHFEARLDTRK